MESNYCITDVQHYDMYIQKLLYMFIEFTSHLKPEILVELYNNDIMGLLMVVNGPFLQDL